jgi:hypothetical protein
LVAVVAGWQTRDTVGFAFVEFDDSINLFVNPHLGPPSQETLSWMFGDMDYMRRYVPLGWLGFSVVYGFSGLSPVGYHGANVLLHVVNATLVFALILELVRRFTPEADDGWRVTAALIGALWWSLHPFRAETVGWASGLLYGGAGGLALLSVLMYLQAGEAEAGRGRRLIVAGLLYTASLLVYPMGLGLVGVYFLLDVAHRPLAPGLSWRRLVREKALLAVPFGGGSRVDDMRELYGAGLLAATALVAGVRRGAATAAGGIGLGVLPLEALVADGSDAGAHVAGGL